MIYFIKMVIVLLRPPPRKKKETIGFQKKDKRKKWHDVTWWFPKNKMTKTWKSRRKSSTSGSSVYVDVHLGKLTWNLKIIRLKRRHILQTFVSGFHVKFRSRKEKNHWGSQWLIRCTCNVAKAHNMPVIGVCLGGRSLLAAYLIGTSNCGKLPGHGEASTNHWESMLRRGMGSSLR